MSNQKSGILVNRAAQERAFDSLPPRIRHVIAHAPYDYAATGFAKAWRTNGMDKQAFRQFIIERICADIQKHARKIYGPDHPDAQRSRLTRRHEVRP